MASRSLPTRCATWQRTGEFNVDIRNGLSDILSALQTVGQRIADATSIDMSIAEKSQATLHELGSELIELTSQAREHSRHITATCRANAQPDAGRRDTMQFEDIVTQMMDRINQRASNVGEYMHAFLPCTRTTMADGPAALPPPQPKLVQLLVNSHVRATPSASNAASQCQMRAAPGNRRF